MTLVMNYLMNLFTALGDRARSERGDVPGWVLITIMSAGLVILLWTVAGELLVQVFQDAINRVSGN